LNFLNLLVYLYYEQKGYKSFIWEDFMDKEEKKEEAGLDLGNAAQNKYMWVVGAILLLIAGWFGWNMLFGSGGEYSVTLVNGPQEVTSGIATFTWRVDGPATTIPDAEVYFGTVSNPGELKKDVKPSDTKYTDYVKDFSNGKYNIPLQFVGNAGGFTTPGTYYYRVHATIKNKNYWSDEYTLEVKKLDDKITIINVPKETAVNQLTAFTWRVDGMPKTIPSTAFYFGKESTPGTLGFDVKPEATKYTEHIMDFAQGTYNIPLAYVGNHKFTKAGTYYIRLYALIDGKNFWSEESTIEVKPAALK
jgi:hypothetical protein